MKRILVADDSVTIQKVIALTFADEPFDVQSVGTGSEALELVKSWKPDIVLADVIMPQMNGYELCRAVKQQETESPVPVLLLAGTFEAFDEEEARSVGADGFITKPFESGELIEKVRALLGDTPPAPAAEAAPAPAAQEAAAPMEAAPEPEAAAQVPASPPGDPAEPDIWDILSESGEEAHPSPAGADAQPPGFGPIEGGGVVDVGSFDVGIGRPESQPPPPQAPVEQNETARTAGPVEAQQAPPVSEPAQDMDEKSRVENMEKDFFGFETGAVEEVPGTDFLDDAVEEVTFEIEPPPTPGEADPQEVSFVVPEPVMEQAAVTGETVSPDLMAPEAPVEPAPQGVEAAPAPGPAVFTEGPAGGAETAAQADPQPPVEVPVPDSIDIQGFAPEPAPEFEPVPEPSAAVDAETASVPAAPVEMELQPEPEPPLELPVDLAQDLPDEFSPEPAAPPIDRVPSLQPEAPPSDAAPVGMPADQAAEAPKEDAPSAGTGVPDDEAIRKIVEEKVEKIAWEVVPEMAEVIIREAIQKIKDGS